MRVSHGVETRLGPSSLRGHTLPPVLQPPRRCFGDREDAYRSRRARHSHPFSSRPGDVFGDREDTIARAQHSRSHPFSSGLADVLETVRTLSLVHRPHAPIRFPSLLGDVFGDLGAGHGPRVESMFTSPPRRPAETLRPTSLLNAPVVFSGPRPITAGRRGRRLTTACTGLASLAGEARG